MGIDAKEKTALGASVGADAGQSIQKESDNSIPASEAKRQRGKWEIWRKCTAGCSAWLTRDICTRSL